MREMAIYIISGILAVFWGWLCQRKKISFREDPQNPLITGAYSRFSAVCFFISFLCLAIPSFCCGEGTDMPVYVNLYKSWTLSNLTSTKFEPGFILVTLVLRVFFKNPYVGLGILKVLSIFLVYRALYMLRDRISMGLSITSYVVLLYIYNFHLLRISLAIGMVFLALSCDLCGRKKAAVLLLVGTAFVHYSSLMVLAAFLVYRLLGRKIQVTKIILLGLSLVVFYAGIMPFIENLTVSVSSFDKYSVYLKNKSSDIGIVQFVLFIPILYILLMNYRHGKGERFYILSFLFGIMLFFSGSLGYLFPVAGRMTYYFFWFAVVFFGATPLMRDRIVFVAGKVRVNSVTVVSFLYLALQALITYVLTNSFVSNGLTRYTFWWRM